MPVKSERARYALIQILGSGRDLEGSRVWSVVSRSFSNLFGVQGHVGAGLFFLQTRCGKGTIVIRVSHAYILHLRAAIAAVTEIDGQEVILWVTRLGGTVKSLMRKGSIE